MKLPGRTILFTAISAILSPMIRLNTGAIASVKDVLMLFTACQQTQTLSFTVHEIVVLSVELGCILVLVGARASAHITRSLSSVATMIVLCLRPLLFARHGRAPLL